MAKMSVLRVELNYVHTDSFFCFSKPVGLLILRVRTLRSIAAGNVSECNPSAVNNFIQKMTSAQLFETSVTDLFLIRTVIRFNQRIMVKLTLKTETCSLYLLQWKKYQGQD